MFTRLLGAMLRAGVVAATVLLPAVLLPEISSSAADLAIVVSAIAATFILIEYGARCPSFIEFRFAAPYNRFRVAFLITVTLAVILAINPRASIFDVDWLQRLVQANSQVWNFAYSPYNAFEGLVATADFDSQKRILDVAGMGLTMALLFVVISTLLLIALAWPLDFESFNIWANMPTFDLSNSEAAPMDLRRSALISVMFGCAFPFLAPWATLTFFGELSQISPANILFMVWLITIWTYVPAASILRGIALLRVAESLARENTRTA